MLYTVDMTLATDNEVVPFPIITEVNFQQLTHKEHGYLCVHYISCHNYNHSLHTIPERPLLGSGV